jgi:hypothetical protein
MDRLYSRRT